MLFQPVRSPACKRPYSVRTFTSLPEIKTWDGFRLDACNSPFSSFLFWPRIKLGFTSGSSFLLRPTSGWPSWWGAGASSFVITGRGDTAVNFPSSPLRDSHTICFPPSLSPSLFFSLSFSFPPPLSLSPLPLYHFLAPCRYVLSRLQKGETGDWICPNKIVIGTLGSANRPRGPSDLFSPNSSISPSCNSVILFHDSSSPSFPNAMLNELFLNAAAFSFLLSSIAGQWIRLKALSPGPVKKKDSDCWTYGTIVFLPERPFTAGKIDLQSSKPSGRHFWRPRTRKERLRDRLFSGWENFNHTIWFVLRNERTFLTIKAENCSYVEGSRRGI